MKHSRLTILNQGLAELPKIEGSVLSGKNGESLATDEASVWKRVINYRIASYYKPGKILETHPGLNISTSLFRLASPSSKIFFKINKNKNHVFDLIDIDPFGSPWKFINSSVENISNRGVLMVSSGEALAVARNLKMGQPFPSRFYGKDLPKWVLEEHIPRMELATNLEAQFFYAFPTTVRVILSNFKMSRKCWEGCPQWMWWLNNYAPDVRI